MEDKKKEVVLDREIHLGMLLRFALPTILSTVFMSIYTSVDGMFVARLINTDALSAVNIVMPLVFISTGIGTMFGSGGNALVARKLGEKKEQEAREDFSLLLVTSFVVSLLVVLVCALFLHPLLRLLGANEALVPYCVDYLIPVLITLPFSVFGTMLSMSYITVGKARFGLWMSVLGGVLNIVLDWLFIAVFDWGITGAAVATSITIMLYVQALFNSVYRGYAMGIAPIISFNYGADNRDRLKKIHSISLKMILTASVILTGLCVLFAPAMVKFFAGNNQAVYEMALHGFRIFSTSCLLVGINVYASALFTALNDGRTSAILSFCRAVVFLVIPVLALPPLIGLDGVWASIPVGEVLALVMSIYYFRKLKF